MYMTHPPPLDEELLVAARRDARAFTELYDRHASGIARWLRRRSAADTALELLAETWAEAWACRARFRPEQGTAKAWLYAIARHQLLHFYRSHEVEQRARRRLGVSVPIAQDDTSATDARVDAQALRSELEALLSNLSPAVREAVVLRAVEQLDHREIAVRTGCSPQAARLRVSRGLRALRHSWDAHGDPVACSLRSSQTTEGLLT
jgi:RNA polymerase sigma-70 factor (ECF subfamily)